LNDFARITTIVHKFVCLSVRLSVTRRYCTKTAKHIGSHKQRRTIAQLQGLYSFLMPKISSKFQQGHSKRGQQIGVGLVQIGDFRPLSRYISETVQDSDIVTVES